MPYFNAESLVWGVIGDFTVISWETPTGFFTRVTVQQCNSNDGLCSEPYDVTGVNTLDVSESDGTELELIVWQNQDPVLRYRLSLKDKDNKSGKMLNLDLVESSKFVQTFATNSS